MIAQKLYPYVELTRMNKPIGIFLLLWPTLIALWVANEGCPNPTILTFFTIGVVLTRSAGCAINDWTDQPFDAHVQRTQHRPLAVGNIKAWEALIVFIVLSLMAFGIVLCLNLNTILLSLCALFLMIVYPWMKRLFPIPQLILGVAFSMAIPMAFMAVKNTFPKEALVLFIANVLWTIAYDTQYAMADKEDDKKINVHSSAIWFGEYDIQIVFCLHCISLILFFYLGLIVNMGFYYFSSIGLSFLFVCYQQKLIQTRNPKNCLLAFRNNQYLGATLFAGVFLTFVKTA